MNYDTFEHGSDIGIRGFGDNLEEAFQNIALALFSVIVNINNVTLKEQRTVSVTAPDQDLLLVEWLNALLSLSDAERMVFSKFDVKIDGNLLTGTVWGETLDHERHEPNVEVKGATYHLLSVKKENNRYVTQCVVDV